MTYATHSRGVGGTLSRGERPEHGRFAFSLVARRGPDPERIAFISLGAGGSDRGSVGVTIEIDDAAVIAHALLDAVRAIGGLATRRQSDGAPGSLNNTAVHVGVPTAPVVDAPVFVATAPPWVPRTYNTPAYAFTIEAAGPPLWDRWTKRSVEQSGRLYAHAVAAEGRPWRYVFLTSAAPGSPAPHGVEPRASASFEDTAAFAHAILDTVNGASGRCTCRAA